MISKTKILFFPLGLAALSGCKYDDQFRNAPITAPHAIITAAPAEHWRDRGPLVSHIKRQPTTFWRSDEKHCLPPGDTVLQVIADSEPYDYAPIYFTVVAGRRYHLTYDKDRSHVLLHDIAGSESKLIVKSAREKAVSP